MARSAVAPLLLALALVATACASDPRIQHWVDRWQGVERQHEAGEHEAAIDGFRELHRRAPTRVDGTMVRLREARALDLADRPDEAFALLADVGQEAARKMDRGRARLDQARLAEERGHLTAALRLYRRVVLTYPELMPGLRALQHLERLAERGGARAVDRHLQWSLVAYETLGGTSLGDNLLFFAADQAYQRWRAGGTPRLATITERLLQRLHARHYRSALWDEAMWRLSWLYHRQGRYADEIRIIRRIQGTRERATFIGSYDSPFYWIGQMRIGRVQLIQLDQPDAAAATFERFVTAFPSSRWRDDALYWAGCAHLRAGDASAAEDAFAQIPRAYSESKYLRRFDAARAAPSAAVCDPELFDEESW